MTAETTAPVSTTPVRERKRSVWKPLAAAGIGGAVLVATGFGVFAQLQATATNVSPQSVSTGDLKLVMAADKNNAGGFTSAAFTTPIANLAPGDAVNRVVTVTNTGSLDGANLKLAVTDSQALSVLNNDAARGLQIAVQNCSVAWTFASGTTPTPNTATPTCSGTTSTALTGSLKGLMAAGASSLAGNTAANTAVAPAAANNVNHYLVAVSLPDQVETSTNGGSPSPASGAGSVQSLTAALTFTFSETQRTATTTNS